MAREKAKKITSFTEPKLPNLNNSEERPYNLFADEVNDIKAVTDNHAVVMDGLGEEFDILKQSVDNLPSPGTSLTTEQIEAINDVHNKVNKDGNKVLSDVNFTQALKDKVDNFVQVNADDFVVKSGTKTLTDVNFTQPLKEKIDGVATGATANSSDANLKSRANHTGTQSADTITDGTTNKAFTAGEKTKLGTVASNATQNSSDATLTNRVNHTGTQAMSTITGLTEALGARLKLSAQSTITVTEVAWMTLADYNAIPVNQRVGTTAYITLTT